MRIEIPYPSADGLPPTFGAEPGVDIPQPDMDLIEAAMAGCRLPPAASWHAAPGWLGFSGHDIGRDSARTSGYARPVTEASEALGALAALDVTPGPDEREWWFRENGFAGMIGDFEGRDDQFMIEGTLSQAGGVQGVLLGGRSMSLAYDASEGVSLTYRIDARLSYVLPGARGKGIGRVLAAALGRMVADDLEAIQGKLPEGPVAIRTHLYGEAQSEGGLALLHLIGDQIDMAGDMTVGPGVYVERDYGL